MNNQNELIQQPSWWKRNWKWALPVGGCLTIIIIGIIVLGGSIFYAFDKIQTETGSDQAFIDAQNNERLIEILGEPIEINGIGNFNISINDESKTSNSTVPIKGPKGEATIHLSVREENGKKYYDAYFVSIEGTDEVVELEKPEIEE